MMEKQMKETTTEKLKPNTITILQVDLPKPRDLNRVALIGKKKGRIKMSVKKRIKKIAGRK